MIEQLFSLFCSADWGRGSPRGFVGHLAHTTRFPDTVPPSRTMRDRPFKGSHSSSSLLPPRLAMYGFVGQLATVRVCIGHLAHTTRFPATMPPPRTRSNRPSRGPLSYFLTLSTSLDDNGCYLSHTFVGIPHTQLGFPTLGPLPAQ